MSSHRDTRGFTLVELLVVIAIIGILIALLLPAVQAAREAARRSQCTNNLKQIALAMHNYHDTHRLFPYGFRTSFPPGYAYPNYCHNRDTWFHRILPYVEQGAMYEEYEADCANVSASTSNHVHNISSSQVFVSTPIDAFICPSEPETPAFADSSRVRWAGNYVGCIGDVTTTNASNTGVNGMLGGNFCTAFRSCEDGSSNTLLFSEAIQRIAVPSVFAWGCAGCYWIGGAHGEVLFTAREAPNTPLADQNYDCKMTNYPGAPCVVDRNTRWNFARSHHPGGVNVCLTDGSVQFTSETIELATFRALSTRRGGEVVSGP